MNEDTVFTKIKLRDIKVSFRLSRSNGDNTRGSARIAPAYISFVDFPESLKTEIKEFLSGIMRENNENCEEIIIDEN